MESINIGLAGLGTVAQGFLEIFGQKKQALSDKLGVELKIAKVASRSQKVDLEELGAVFSAELSSLVEDPAIDVVIELIGGEQDALELISSALKKNKHVVTANKEVIAKHGNSFKGEIDSGQLRFEAAVAGAIPILQGIGVGMVANDFSSITGIVNGTSNYILSNMSQEGASFEESLKQAQELGFAEADPGFDIDGIDAAHKLTIMMALAYGQPFSFDKVMTEGISHITSSDIQYASEMGFAIKPLAVVRRSEGAIAAKVYPALVEFDRILSQVNGVMNAVEVESDFAGRLFFSGPGAGSLATASAVVSDLGLIARNQGSVYPRLTGMEKVGITHLDQSISSCYLRFDVVDEKGIFARITSALSESGISIDEVFQKNLDGGRSSIVMITHPASEKDIDNCLSNVGELSELLKPIQRIRVLS